MEYLLKISKFIIVSIIKAIILTPTVCLYIPVSIGIPP